MVSKGGLEPPRPKGASPLNWCVCLFRHFDKGLQASELTVQKHQLGREQECESDHCEDPYSCQDRCDAVEVLLGSC